MMTSSDLQKANMEIEQLFETQSIPDIVAYARNLSQDIDRKREELRTMVGERYRDLMEAADTITHMKESSDQVISSLEGVLGQGADVHNKALMGFRSVVKENTLTDDPNQPYLSVAAEIKVLMMAPEKIWSSVESKDYLTAAQLYLFSRHIHTNLTLSEVGTNNSMSSSMTSSVVTNANVAGKVVSNHFPVVNRQWASIAHFYDVILQGCQQMMSQTQEADGDEGLEKVVQAIAAFALLKGLTTEEVFLEFISLRNEALKEQLKADKETETAKVLMEDALKLIRSCLLIINRAFTDNEDGNILTQLTRVSITTLTYFETRLSPIFKYLPALISEFCPNTLQTMNVLSKDFLASKIMSWLDKLHQSLSEDAAYVLQHVKSIPALANIRKHCYDILDRPKKGNLTPENWSKLCETLLNKELNLWDEFFRQVFREKMENLISTSIAGSVYCVQSSLSSFDFDSEVDLSSCLWHESNLNEVTTLPKFGEIHAFKNNKPTTFELKALGYSPKVQELCHQFDQELEKLLQDLEQMMNEGEDESRTFRANLIFLNENSNEKRIEPFDMTQDYSSLLQYVQESTITQVKELVEYISSKFLEKQSSRGTLLCLGRFFQAVPELCPSLEKSVLAPQSFTRRNELSSFTSLQQRRGHATKPDPLWVDIKVRLEHESCKAFNLWIGLLTSELKINLTEYLKDDPITLMKMLPAWDVIEISEETEDGFKVTSKIKVPKYLSVGLTCCLSSYCNQVYNIAPYSLPTNVQLFLSQMPLNAVFDAYLDVAQRNNLIQMVALQLHFDLQLISHSMINRDNKELTQLSQTCLSALESQIDPFDFSVFSSHMTNNMKKCVLRECGLFSILIPNDRFSLLSSLKSSLTSKTSSANEQHNAIWTFNYRPDKIPLIPIPKKRKEDRINTRRSFTAGNTLGAGNVVKMSSVSPVLGRKKREKSPVARAAGGFFEAMSSSFFGGGKSS